jgi:hypothetical protein
LRTSWLVFGTAVHGSGKPPPGRSILSQAVGPSGYVGRPLVAAI